jgi:superoxide dismutase, Fe-Mn family
MIDESALKQIVRDSMGMSDLNESYATQAKKFDLNTELLSSDQKKEHQKLFENYVKVLNEVSVKIDAQNWSDAASEHSEYRQLKLDETYNLNAAFLHGLYFDNISDVRSQIAMDSLTFLRLERDFGGFSAWQKDFIACCMSSRNGWVVTVYSTLVNRYMNVVVDLHSTGVPFGAIPIIAMDCWEHAYSRDYLTDKRAYVRAMMKELNWKVIEDRVLKADQISKVIK